MDNANLEISPDEPAIKNARDLYAEPPRVGSRAGAGSATGTDPENGQAARSVLFAMSLFDRLAIPLFMVTQRSVVVWANIGCRRFFARSDQLVLQGDRALAGAPGQRAALAAFFAGRLEHTPRLRTDVFMLERPSGEDGALLVRLTQPFSMQDNQDQVLGIIDPTAGTAKPNALARRLYSLTDAEHELCVALAAGRRLKDWARLRGVTVNTARAQVKSVLGKMGVTAQQDVVRIWLSLSAIDCPATAADLAGSSNVAAHSIGIGIARTAVPVDLQIPPYARPRPRKADGRLRMA